MSRLPRTQPVSRPTAADTRAKSPMFAGRVVVLALSALIGIAAAARTDDALAQPAALPSGAGAQEYHTRYRSEADDLHRVVEIEGRVRFSADASRIEWMAEGSYLLIVTNDRGSHVRLRAEPDGHGQPTYRFDIDGQANRATGDIDGWLARTLPVVFRELGHDADARVGMAYDQGGAEAVFGLFAAIRSDYSAGLHYAAYFGRKDLSDDEVIGAPTHLGDDIDSDQELTTVLFAAAKFYYDRPAVRTSFLACFDRLDSAVARSRIAHSLFGTDDISGDAPPTMATSPGDC